MNKQLATLAGGCFWCTEAVFRRLTGVLAVKPGYSGGTVKNPTYRQVAAGLTGHAESIQIDFDPAQVSYQQILTVFFDTHDPTSLNRQGDDVGPQYRSVIFYHDDDQKLAAVNLKKEINGAVTDIVPFDTFYPAEDYHQNYYENHRAAAYCQFVIDPKIKKLSEKHKDKLRL